jgi:serine/threonine protein kinase
MKDVSKEAKDLIARMLVPADKRISMQAIFEHPWMSSALPATNLKVSFRRLHEFSKFSKVPKV